MKNIYSIENIKKIHWIFLEENQPISLYPVMYPGWCGIIKGTGKILGRPQKNIICIHRKNNGIIFGDHKEWMQLGKYTLIKIIKNPIWGFKLNKKILKLSDELVDFSSKIFKNNLKVESTIELYKLYKAYLERQSRLYNYAVVPVYLDLYKPHLTNYLINYLNKQITKIGYHKTGKECFTLLTIPEKLSKVQEEEKALLVLATQKNILTNKKIIHQHAESFRYLGYNFEGPAFPDSYFLRRIKECLNDSVNPLDKLNLMLNKKKQEKSNHNKILDDLKVDQKHRLLLNITQSLIYSKDYRKMSLVQSYYEIEPLLEELAKRLSLSLFEIRNCLLKEIKRMAYGYTKRPSELHKRARGCLFVVINQNLPGKVFTDETFKVISHHLLTKEDLTTVNYFHGQPACLGQAQGRVKIINTTKDLIKMKKGDILVSRMTNPDLVSAMKIASAIVTDLGGITSHAAIVSRELNVPCVIGTKIATKALKDGDMVQVNANSGEVKKL